jgi:hypothetical protein
MVVDADVTTNFILRSLVLALLVFHTAVPLAAGAQDSAAAPAAQRPVRRIPVTPELERTAFVDARARTLLARARTARITQDSGLRAYDARTLQRITVGLEIKRFGLGRTLLRAENAAHVQWSRGSGIWIEPTGRRAVAPMVKEAHVMMDLTAATPIPYFPGRESLWLPSSYARVAQLEVNEEDLLHPLASGAEAYYRFATGDSMSLRLPEGRVIALRELRITARRPEWRAFVGSFWFDVDQGHLVRAVYRLATDIDFWKVASEEQKREIQNLERIAAADTGEAARLAKEKLGSGAVEGISAIVRGIVTSFRGSVSSITVEYGLYEGRFWLPRLNIAEGEVQVSFMRMPIRIEEAFRYDDVNGDRAIARIPTSAEITGTGIDTTTSASFLIGTPPAALDDSVKAARARGDTLGDKARADLWSGRLRATADTLRMRADSARVAGDTVRARQRIRLAEAHEAQAREIIRRAESCATDSTYISRVNTRYGGAVRVAVRMPCDTTKLATSPDLPPNIYEPAEDFFGTEEERNKFLESLGLNLQGGWGPQPPTLHAGLDLVRYNRIEGLSVGLSAASQLGFGYSARAEARFGIADRVPNGEISVARSNGRSELRLGMFHRLAVANDDWGSPLSFGASLSNVIFGRDEGFYYRTWGAELSGVRDAPGASSTILLWRLFAERQRSAEPEPNTQFSLAHVLGDRDFARNIDAPSLTSLGVSGEMARAFGRDPSSFRLAARTRAEAAAIQGGDLLENGNYARLLTSATAGRALGPISLSITGAAGAATEDLPVQRAFYVGGLHTVRGQSARPDTLGFVGNSMWLGRGELGLAAIWAKPVLFYDVGWAGRREDFTKPGRPLSGAGVGLSLLDGLIRTDLSRGIWPEKHWRLDLYLDALF